MSEVNKRLRAKAVLLIFSLLLLICIIFIVSIIKKGSDSGVESIAVEDVADMLQFTTFTSDEWIEHIKSVSKDELNYQGVILILDSLNIMNKEKEEYSKTRGARKFSKSEWNELYKKIVNELDSEGRIKFQEVFVIADKDNCSSFEDNVVYTDTGFYEWNTHRDKKNYMFYSANVILDGKSIIFADGVNESSFTLHNVYFVDGNESGIKIYLDDKYLEYKNQVLENAVSSEIGDIVFENGSIAKIRLKQDKISGKLLSIQDNGLEIENYGLIEYDEGFKVYKEYGVLDELKANDLLVGYNVTEFIVADGKVSAALVMRDLVMDNIRVLIRTNDHADIYHNEVIVEGDTDYTIYYADKSEKHSAGEQVVINADSDMWELNRIKIEPDTLSGKIKLLSITRNLGNPSYRGSIEVARSEAGLIVINDLSMEEYLYKVVPSEMPESFGIEALKAQAVCARSYAYNHVLNNAFSQYGAHVDDSVNFQVYNNQDESTLCTMAVKETYGQVLAKDDTVIDTYYFSTSGGHTTNSEVWEEKEEKDRSYLQGKFIGEDSDLDLTDETVFYDYVKNNTYEGYEADEPWYRWNTTISVDNLSYTLNSRLDSRYSANPDLILTKNEDGEYESKEITTIGKIKNIKTIHRNDGGVLYSIVIEGTKATIKVITEYNIRYLLAPETSTVNKNDGTSIEGFSLLPSAYCVVDKTYEDEELSGFTFTGGGYGHGVGMSQNGAKVMAAMGNNYEYILKYFYTGVELKSIY